MIHRVLIAGLAILFVGSCGGGGAVTHRLVPAPGSGASGGSTSSTSQSSSSSSGNDASSSAPSLPTSVEQDYLNYEAQLLDVKAHYGSKPHALNTSALWYKSLSYPSSAVVSKDAKVLWRMNRWNTALAMALISMWTPPKHSFSIPSGRHKSRFWRCLCFGNVGWCCPDFERNEDTRRNTSSCVEQH